MTREYFCKAIRKLSTILYHVVTVVKYILVKFGLQTPPTYSVKARRRKDEKVRFHQPCSLV